jgi:MFS family permease
VDARGTLRAYFRYQATANCVFFAPVFYVYYEERVGLAVSTILFVQSYYLAVRSVFDLPLGALADRYSRRACLVVYGLGLVAGSTLVLAWPTFAGVVVAETIFAIGGAARSGADSAFLYDALKSAGRLDLYTRAEGRAQAIMSLASGATAVAGGLLASADLRLPYVATATAAAVSVVLVGRMPEGRGVHDPSRPPLARLLREAAAVTAGSSAVRWVIGLATFAVVASHVYYYLQQPYLRAVGIPIALFGAFFALTKVMTALVSNAAHRVDAATGARGAAAIMSITPVVGLSAMSAITSPLGAALLLTRGVLDGLWQPLTNVYLNRLVDSRVRATMLSVQSVVSRFALAAALAGLGVGTARVGLAATLALAACAVALAGAALVLAAPAAVAAVDDGARACRAESV